MFQKKLSVAVSLLLVVFVFSMGTALADKYYAETPYDFGGIFGGMTPAEISARLEEYLTSGTPVPEEFKTTIGVHLHSTDTGNVRKILGAVWIDVGDGEGEEDTACCPGDCGGNSICDDPDCRCGCRNPIIVTSIPVDLAWFDFDE